MLILVGMGIHGYKGLSIEAMEAIKDADKVYVEAYTSPVKSRDIDALRALRDDVVEVHRWFVEDGRRILDEARAGDVVLLAYGDPLIATTHIELLVRARSSGIACKVIHSSSIVTAALGECGLHVYKLGRVATVVSNPIANTSTYYAIYSNLMQMNHTLLLLEYDQEHGYFLAVDSALRLLLDCEARERMNAIDEDTFAIVASRVGMEDMGIVGGRIGSLLKYSDEHGFGEPPHTLIVTGSLHFTEVEALRASVMLLDEPIDNSKRVRARAEMMLPNYIARAYNALSRAREYIMHAKGSAGDKAKDKDKDDTIERIKDMIDNAEYYLSDAERFAREHRYENAILALGYAEGLIDALRYLRDIDPWESKKSTIT
ncbi:MULTISPECIES: diphthine synthase [Candidatus Nitrosocaldus]|jgi:diphthine synthase|uniref:Diphthine synthase n=1 Tax=Candidatus Nitrosocaldus cavascurensis TaxID=2058097 RepID=A0A2K5ASG9_9ARCH|nr:MULTISPECIES: diphthine synthase [Candidatus Nitrosocaldus]SPC34559.1 Diphthine synthase [Candidatus Nitrosocaldus cavascurensis]